MAAEFVTAAQMNAELRDNLNYLYSNNAIVLGRQTLTAVGDSLDLSGLLVRRHLKILIACLPSGAIQPVLRFNADSTASYSERFATDGGADAANVNQTGLNINIGAQALPFFAVYQVLNITAQSKIIAGKSAVGGGSAATAPANRRELAGKWANSAVGISGVNVVNIAAGDFAVGSELIVLGHD